MPESTLHDRAQAFAETGLRARKRRRQLLHIQAAALDLFDAEGFEQVTVEQVAAAAEVSPSTVYRQFGSKEHLVLYDELHLAMALTAAGSAAGGLSLAGLHRAVQDAITALGEEGQARLRRRLGYVYAVPSINGAMLAELDDTEQYARELFAGSPEQDGGTLEVRVLVSSLTAAYRVALRYWYDHAGTSLRDVVEQALAPFSNPTFGSWAPARDAAAR